LFFRGYLVQQLGARFRNPLIWGLLPALVFGWIHYANGSFPEYSYYYVVSATLFALIATVTVWRTGSLSMAMGMHAANNFASFMIVGTSDTMNSTQIWLLDIDDVMKSAPSDMAMLALLLAFVLSPWAPMPKRQLFAFRKEARAAP
jgi:membrane protease YdiL (CAAX protease family)